MCPPRAAVTPTEQYDQALHYARDARLPPGAPQPCFTRDWPAENIEFLERYAAWLLGGGVSEMVTRTYHIPMAGHVLGLNLKPYHQLDPDADLDCALAYIQARDWGRSGPGSAACLW